NFPDPFFYQSSGKWYALASNNAAGILNASTSSFPKDYGKSNIQIATSTDLLNWDLSPQSSTQVLANPGNWSLPGTHTVNNVPPVPKASVWAPDLYQQTSENKDLLLYYSAASSTNPSRHCIGVASAPVSASPSGPFQPTSPTPLICPLPQGGAIDPSSFTDADPSHTLYLVYKIDGNALGHGGECSNTVAPQQSTPLMLQRLAPDGLGVAEGAAPTQLLDRGPGDGPLVEAPVLVRSDGGVYFLFFSSGCTRADDYKIEYATADAVAGPYVRAGTPLVQTGDFGGLVAPGSVTVVKGGGAQGWVMGFAARVQSAQGGVRELFVTGLEMDGKSAKVV
ncbi:glycoside hydrolase family 43 protein, partial [Viridothelium virens]